MEERLASDWSSMAALMVKISDEWKRFTKKNINNFYHSVSKNKTEIRNKMLLVEILMI